MAGYIIYSLDWDKFRQLVERPTKAQLTALAKWVRGGLEEHDGEFDEDDPISDWPTDARSLSRIVAERLPLQDWYGDLSRAGKSLWEGVIFGACLHGDGIDVGFRVDNDGVYWDVIELAWKHLGVVPDQITEVALSAFGTRPYRYHPPRKPGKTRAEHDREVADRKASLDALGKSLNKLLEGIQRGEKDPARLLDEIEGMEGVSREHKDLIKGFIMEEEFGVDEDDEDEDDSEEWTPMHSMHTPDEVRRMREELRSAEPAMKAAKDKEARRQYEEDLMPAIDRVGDDGRMLFIQVDT
jgi:hypothetical protein